MSSRPAAFGLLLWALLGGCHRETAPTPSSSTASPKPIAVATVTASSPRGERPSASDRMVGLPVSFAPLVKRAKPSVVTIMAWRRTENAFGRRTLDAQGVGTGFVYDAAGILLTNHHVIANASEIIVRFASGKELPATVVGSDKPTDVAVIKVADNSLEALPVGDSMAIEVGDWVVAIGNPFGLEHTVSAGIVSAKGRSREDVKGLDPSGYFNFLQTDASINPGNSGGPLLNLAGQVVGINSAVRANANNIGFAIPMEMVLKLLPMLLRDGEIKRSAIGIWVDDVSPSDVKTAKRGSRRGAKVTRVVTGGGADRAGLATGDVVLSFDGKPIKNSNELRWLASIAGIGRKVEVELARGKRVFKLFVTLDPLKAE